MTKTHLIFSGEMRNCNKILLSLKTLKSIPNPTSFHTLNQLPQRIKFPTNLNPNSHEIGFFYPISSSRKGYAKNAGIKCWQCGIDKRNIAELFCEKCSVVQQPQNTQNFFKIFEIKEEFNVDLKALSSKYRQMQSLLHPDKFSNKSDAEKEISEEFSALLNKAYNVLHTPLKRAVHLLSLRGENIEEKLQLNNPEFLMEIMELNEQVENANTPEKLQKLDAKNKEELEAISKLISENFKENRIANAKENIIKMKYYTNIGGHISSLMREKGIVD